jgi:hypothetical protein
MALHMQVASYTPIPYWDFWDSGVHPARAALAGDLRPSDLWAQHNEHRVLISRLQFIADYALFGGRLVFPLTMIFVSSVLLALALAWPSASVWSDRTLMVGFFAFALAATLSPVGIENIIRPFQVGFVQVYLFAVTAITLTVCWLRTEREPPCGLHAHAILWIVVLGAAATYSMANGLMVWPILVAVMFLRRIGRTSSSVVAIAGLAFTASYLWGYERPVPVGTDTPSYTESLRHPVDLARSVATFLGHPAQGLGSVAVQLVGVLGGAVLACLVALAIRDREFPDRRATTFGAAVGMFVLLSSTATALKNFSWGIEAALASRYMLGAAVFWVGLAIGVAPLASRHAAVLLRTRSGTVDVTGLAFVSICLGAVLVVNIAAYPTAQALYAIRTRSEPMLIAFVADVEDDAARSASYPWRSVSPELNWLRAERVGPWSTGLGQALEDAQRRVDRPNVLPPCRGVIDSTTAVHRGKRLDGWVVPPAGRKASREVAVVDASGAPGGVGLVDVHRPDVKAAGFATSNFSGFVAYGRGTRVVAYLVLFDSISQAPLCSLAIRRA